MRASPFLLLLALAPLGASAGAFVVLDPAGDQETDIAYVDPVLAPVGGHGDPCEDPAYDFVAVDASATADVIHMEGVFRDPAGPFRCFGQDLSMVPPGAGAPWYWIELREPGAGGAALRVSTHRDIEGVRMVCARYSSATTFCEPGSPPFEVPTRVTGNDGVHDLRGRAFEMRGLSLSAYGYEDPKAKPIMLWDHVASDGVVFAVPS